MHVRRRVFLHRGARLIDVDIRHRSYFPAGAVGIRYTTVKMMIHTMSTKCQYSPTISTGNAGSSGSRSANDIPVSDSNIKMPTVTWTPWKPVRTKNVVPKRFV